MRGGAPDELAASVGGLHPRPAPLSAPTQPAATVGEQEVRPITMSIEYKVVRGPLPGIKRRGRPSQRPRGPGQRLAAMRASTRTPAGAIVVSGWPYACLPALSRVACCEECMPPSEGVSGVARRARLRSSSHGDEHLWLPELPVLLNKLQASADACGYGVVVCVSWCALMVAFVVRTRLRATSEVLSESTRYLEAVF